MRQTKTRKKDVSGLVYDKSQGQYGKGGRNRGFTHVVSPPTKSNNWNKECLFKINTPTNGYVLVQFLKSDIDISIKSGVDHFFENHKKCRETGFDGGTMVAAGHHYEIRSTTVTSYVREKDPNQIDFNKDNSNTQKMERRKKCLSIHPNNWEIKKRQ